MLRKPKCLGKFLGKMWEKRELFPYFVLQINSWHQHFWRKTVRSIRKIQIFKLCLQLKLLKNTKNACRLEIAEKAAWQCWNCLKRWHALVLDESFVVFYGDPFFFKRVTFQPHIPIAQEHLADVYRHLTNYSINKGAENFQENQRVQADNYGHKWSLSALNRHLRCTLDDWERLGRWRENT